MGNDHASQRARVKSPGLSGAPRRALRSATWALVVVFATVGLILSRADRALAAMPGARYERTWLWALGLLTLLVLSGALWNARTQALRLVDRTTELEKLSEQLMRANEVKTEFLANVSHE